MIAIMYFVVADKIEFRFVSIGHHNGTFRFCLDLLQRVFGGLFVAPNDVSIVEWSTTSLWQWHQLAVEVCTEQVEDDLREIENIIKTFLIHSSLGIDNNLLLHPLYNRYGLTSGPNSNGNH